MRLVDRVAQSHMPFIASSTSTGSLTRLSGASDCATDAANCPIRYVLSDELTRLCAALAYSKGARTLSCTDLVRIPAERLWVEWAYAPWRTELDRYGFAPPRDHFGNRGRRGAMLTASQDGRRGRVRTFWCTGETETDVWASSMLGHFDFDSSQQVNGSAKRAGCLRVRNGLADESSVLSTSFCFEFEKTWEDYYDRAKLPADKRREIELHSLGTIALDIPLLLGFFLLLNTRTGLPQQTVRLDRLNRSRIRDGKVALLDHVNVRAPFPCSDLFVDGNSSPSERRRPRLHHVRGHLVRRRNELFWRVPHLRGNASAGVLKTRTVTWAFESN
jgi:hypothetical protein